MKNDRVKLNVVVRDLCAANNSNCQRELVVKRGFRVDRTQKQIEDTLYGLLRQMNDGITASANATGSINFAATTETENYNYLWAYCTLNNGELIAGFMHLLPNSEVVGDVLEDFLNWLEMIVANWMAKNGLTVISVKRNNQCSYILKLAYELP